MNDNKHVDSTIAWSVNGCSRLLSKKVESIG